MMTGVVLFFNRIIKFDTGEVIEGEKVWRKYKELIKTKKIIITLNGG